MSTEYVYTFLSNVPVWVYPLFAVLVILGTSSRRSRSIPTKAFWFMPMLGLIGVPTLIATGRPEAFSAFALAYALGALAGNRFQQGVVDGLEDGRIRLKGEWFTLTAMMVLFFAGFMKGAVGGMNPQLSQSLAFILPMVVVTAFFSGTFLGRSLYVIGFARRLPAN